MRELKFRAFDKEERNFMYFDVTDGLKTECDDTYIRLNVRGIDQYIGLKDKNGKEGYHNDIAEGLGRWLIEWDDNEGGFYLKSLIGYEKLPLRKLKKMNIIGNIWANPELFGAKK